MRYKQPITTSLVGLTLLSVQPSTQAAPVVQLTTGFESSRLVDGFDISDGKPAINLAADLSFENGSFAGVDCYKTETLFFRDGIDTGCDYYLGYFTPIGDDQAFSAALSRGEYAPTPGRQWDYTAASLSWHKNRSTIFTLSAVDDWFGRGYTSVGLNAAYQHPLNDHLSANIQAGYTDFGSSAPVNSIEHARLGLRLEKGRWTSELNLHINDNRLRQLLPFDFDQTAFSLRVIYRLY